MKFLIFSKKFYKVHNVELLSQGPINKKNSSSLIIRNMELRFEPCVLNLIWKWRAKDPKRREDRLIFINFGVKKFTLKNTQKKITLMFECYNLSHRMRSSNFLRLIYNKVILGSYSYFLKFSYFYFLRNWFFQLCKKLSCLVKKHKEF
jgi:hypothetical protein